MARHDPADYAPAAAKARMRWHGDDYLAAMDKAGWGDPVLAAKIAAIDAADMEKMQREIEFVLSGEIEPPATT